MKKLIVLGLCLAMTVTCICACGNNGTATTAAASAEETTVAAGEETTAAAEDASATEESASAEEETTIAYEPIDRSNYKTNSTVKLADYKKIELNKSDLEITDDSLDVYINSFLSNHATTESVTEGVVEDGDVLIIDYEGKLDGTPFEGGTAEGARLEIGSGMFIDGFESGLIGKNIGDTVDLNLTFPEDYSAENLAGKDVVFTVTIHSKEVTTTPELTDELAKENSKAYLGEQADTADEFRATLKKILERTSLESALTSYFLENSEINLDESDDYYQELKTFYKDSITASAESMGTTAEEMIASYGYDDVDAYVKDQVDNPYSQYLIYDNLAKELNISLTDEQIDESMQKMLENQGLAGTYTLDEFKALNGDTWVHLYKTLGATAQKVIDTLEANVVEK